MLAQLEDEGYVHQPHTSAGRVPTDRGYRVLRRPAARVAAPRRPASAVEAQLREQAGTPALSTTCSRRLARAVAGVAPRRLRLAAVRAISAVLQQIEFVPLAGTQVLVVVVARGSQVSQKVIDVGEALDIARPAPGGRTTSTREFAGLPLGERPRGGARAAEQERTLYDALLARALRLARSTFEELPRSRALFVEGAASLLDDVVAGRVRVSLATLRALLEMIEEKERLVRLLNEYIDGPGLTVVIGDGAHGTRPAPVQPDRRHLRRTASRCGTVGVIGPTRMRYSRAISVVDGATQAVSRVLRDGN